MADDLVHLGTSGGVLGAIAWLMKHAQRLGALTQSHRDLKEAVGEDRKEITARLSRIETLLMERKQQ